MERGCFPSNRHQGWDKNGSPIVTLATATRLGSGDWTQEYEGHKVLHTLKQVETSGRPGWGEGWSSRRLRCSDLTPETRSGGELRTSVLQPSSSPAHSFLQLLVSSPSPDSHILLPRGQASVLNSGHQSIYKYLLRVERMEEVSKRAQNS